MEEEAVPSWPLESIRTGTASLLPVLTPRMPAMKVLVLHCPGTNPM
jgi:hypothetical protein